MTATVIVFFHAVITVGNESVFSKAEKYPPTIFRNPNIRQLTDKNQKTATFINDIMCTLISDILFIFIIWQIYLSIISINIYTSNFRCTTGREKTMNKEQEQQILDYYSTTDKYIHSKLHSNAHQSVFTKENDKYQWLVLEQKSQCEVEVRQTDRHGTITARDNYELTRNIPKCVGVERLCKDVNMQLPFNADEINLIYQFGEQSKAETCASLSAEE